MGFLLERKTLLQKPDKQHFTSKLMNFSKISLLGTKSKNLCWCSKYFHQTMIIHEIQFRQMIRMFEPFDIRFYVALSKLSFDAPLVYYIKEIIYVVRNATEFDSMFQGTFLTLSPCHRSHLQNLIKEKKRFDRLTFGYY
jgi:hypothetical protein